LNNISLVLDKYQQLRIPRTKMILGASKGLGAMQQKRAESRFFNWKYEMGIKFQVSRHGTLPVMFDGAGYDYRAAVEAATNEAAKI
jgi:hypothetical protein